MILFTPCTYRLVGYVVGMGIKAILILQWFRLLKIVPLIKGKSLVLNKTNNIYVDECPSYFENFLQSCVKHFQ